jgi:hypothetical protein
MTADQYRRAKVQTGAISLRLKMYGAFPFQAGASALFRRRSAYLVPTNPFFLPLLISTMGRLRNISTVQWLYDLFPDALIVAGSVREKSWQAGILRRITSASFRQAQATVFLGERIAQYAQTRYGPIRRPTTIPLGVASDLFATGNTPLPSNPSNGRGVSILYCGHFGLMHDFTTIAQSLNLLLPQPGEMRPLLKLVFHASGPGLDSFKRKLGRESGGGKSPSGEFDWETVFRPSLDEDAWKETLPAYPIGLVTMAPGAERVVMPSKTYSAMMAAQAILAVCPLNSDLADMVLRHDCGWVIVPGSSNPESDSPGVFFGADGFLKAVSHFLRSPAEIERKRLNSAAAARKFYSLEAVAKSWDALFKSLGMAPEHK